MIKAAVLGSPIAHSLSPALHRAAYRFLGIEGSYEAIDVTTENLEQFLGAVDDSWTGFSLTMPLKERVLEIVENVELLARDIASANTLVRGGDGWHALTTDVNGFRAAMQFREMENFSSVVLLGSGATARAAARAFDGEGRTITVVHRSRHRESAMIQAAPLSSVRFLTWGTEIPSVDLLVNTTPRTVADEVARDQSHNFGGVLFEALYDPWPTNLLSEWKSRGLPCIDGLDLLVHQGIDQVALMTKMAIVREDLAPVMRQAGLDELLGRRHKK
ncbi:MAG: shikimate dehydrogenase [Actinobacteria bacterium]|nr:shikimate dehydrogenase [Actinomycetota bacterium]